MHWVLLCSALTVPALCLAAPPRGENLVRNPGFEAVTDGRADTWYPAGRGCSLSGERVRSGAVALFCEATSPDETRGAIQDIIFDQKMDGFLYLGVNIWARARNDHIIDPEADGPRLRWGITSEGRDTLHGDGVLVYPGPEGPFGSIRLANIRDGLEDYEYLHLLSELTRDVEQGREACLAVPTSLVQFTRDPGALYAQREAIARRIEGLQARGD